MQILRMIWSRTWLIPVTLRRHKVSKIPSRAIVGCYSVGLSSLARQQDEIGNIKFLHQLHQWIKARHDDAHLISQQWQEAKSKTHLQNKQSKKGWRYSSTGRVPASKHEGLSSNTKISGNTTQVIHQMWIGGKTVHEIYRNLLWKKKNRILNTEFVIFYWSKLFLFQFLTFISFE
jgi:hypothetical protein